MIKVYFIGAGPGDPDLITVKGKRIIESADTIIYAGSLVNEKVLECRKPGAEVYNSASMDLDGIIGVMQKAVRSGKTVARVHTGDPSIYGAVREQAVRLEGLSIEYEIIPGVSSFTAAAAAVKREFTLPGISQTIICTRLEGRTAVPEKESLESLASHRASMAIFLSVHMIRDVTARLRTHYPAVTPVSVIQRATWDDQRIITGTLEDIADRTGNAGISKTALILVGDFLDTDFDESRLYDKNFSHEFRKRECSTE